MQEFIFLLCSLRSDNQISESKNAVAQTAWLTYKLILPWAEKNKCKTAHMTLLCKWAFNP